MPLPRPLHPDWTELATLVLGTVMVAGVTGAEPGSSRAIELPLIAVEPGAVPCNRFGRFHVRESTPPRPVPCPLP